jgi:drug/metabolite transporter (DMT)-like permease
MKTLGYCLALFASVLWGLTYCLDERLLESLSVFKVYFLHCLCGVVVAGAVLLLQVFLQGQPIGSLVSLPAGVSGSGMPLVLLTLLTATTATLCILGSIRLLGANTSAVLEISYPLFVALFSTLIFRGQLQPPVIVGGMFIFLGAAIIVVAS